MFESRTTAELRFALAAAKASDEGGFHAFKTYWNRRSLISSIERELATRAASAPKPPPPPAPPPDPPALDDEQVPGDDGDIRELQEALLAQFKAAGPQQSPT